MQKTKPPEASATHEPECKPNESPIVCPFSKSVPSFSFVSSVGSINKTPTKSASYNKFKINHAIVTPPRNINSNKQQQHGNAVVSPRSNPPGNIILTTPTKSMSVPLQSGSSSQTVPSVVHDCLGVVYDSHGKETTSKLPFKHNNHSGMLSKNDYPYEDNFEEIYEVRQSRSHPSTRPHNHPFNYRPYGEPALSSSTFRDKKNSNNGGPSNMYGSVSRHHPQRTPIYNAPVDPVGSTGSDSESLFFDRLFYRNRAYPAFTRPASSAFFRSNSGPNTWYDEPETKVPEYNSHHSPQYPRGPPMTSVLDHFDSEFYPRRPYQHDILSDSNTPWENSRRNFYWQNDKESKFTKPFNRRSTPPFSKQDDILYVADMLSTMGKECLALYGNEVSWLSKKRCPKRCRVYIIPQIKDSINAIFSTKFNWQPISVQSMWISRQNNCKEILHRHKHNDQHQIRNLILRHGPNAQKMQNQD